MSSSSHVAGDRRTVPRFQREPMRERLDNYVDNNRYHGNPNLTDETDVFDRLYEEDERFNAERQAEQSIQRWKGRR